MRNFFILCSIFFLGCSKEPVVVEVPKCELASITKSGFAVYPLTYDGTKIVKVGDDNTVNSRLYYSSAGRLITIEYPAENPRNKTELVYNSEGRISIEKNYEKSGPNWVEYTLNYFTYSNGKVTAIRETIQWASPLLEFNHEVIWNGNNISRIIIRLDSTAVCTSDYSYDNTRENRISDFIHLYYGDNLRPGFKMPMYYSANLLIKEETNCPVVQTTNISYDFSDSLHQKIFTNGNEYLAYNYECR